LRTASRPEGGDDSQVRIHEFLLALALAVHRASIYPEGHPLVAGLMGSVEGKAKGAFTVGRGFFLGVAGRDLVLDEAPVEHTSPLLRDLVRRLRERHLGGVTFLPGVRAEELRDLFRILSKDSGWGSASVPLPLDSDHLRFHPLDFDRLILDVDAEEDGRPRAVELWLELARSALETEADDPRLEDPVEVARALRRRPPLPQRRRSLVVQLRKLAAELRDPNASPEVREVGHRLERLLEELDEGFLKELLRSSHGTGETQRLVHEASHSLGVESFLKVLRGSVPGEERPPSPALLRALGKLAVHAREGVTGIRPLARSAVQEAVDRLLEGGRLEDPSPARYAAILHAMARQGVGEGAGELRERPVEAGLRIVQMGLELGTWGPLVADAVDQLMELGEASRLIGLLREAETDNPAAVELGRRVVRPEVILELAGQEGVSQEILSELLKHLGERAIDPLLDALAETEYRSTRRRLMEALRALGEPAAVQALRRLDDPRWFVVRNRLALAQELESIPGDFDPRPFLDHEDHRVRAEALSLAMKAPAYRVQALARALTNPDPRIVNRAVHHLTGEEADALLPNLEAFLAGAADPKVQALALRGCVGRSRSREARDLLLWQVTRRSFLFRRLRLRPTTPVVLEGLRILANQWSGEAEARAALRLAASSRDPEVRAAALGGSEP
jgi:hypothetical protein